MERLDVNDVILVEEAKAREFSAIGSVNVDPNWLKSTLSKVHTLLLIRQG